MTRMLPAHVMMSQAAELLINQRHQFLQRCLISVAPGDEQLGHFVRRRRGCGHLDPSFIESLPGRARSVRFARLNRTTDSANYNTFGKFSARSRDDLLKIAIAGR